MASQVQPVSELAFNVSLVAYDFKLPGRKPTQSLAVKKLTKTKNIASLLTSEAATVPDLAPTGAELLSSEDGITGLWVGMRPATATEYTRKASDGKIADDAEEAQNAGKKSKATSSSSTAAKKKGSSVIKNSGYTKIAFDPNALRVIAPFGKENANYYALVNQEDGLCTGYHTPIEEVFFFEEFRDDTATSFQARLTTWGKKVRDACNCQQRVTWTRDYDKTKFTIEAKRSLANELAALVSTYRIGGDKTVLKKAMDLIDSADTDRSLGPIQENIMLYKLVTAKEVLNMQECESALKELQKLAPELESLKIRPDEIQQLSKACLESKIALEYRLIRAFVVDFMRELRRGLQVDLAALATATRDHVFLQMGQVSFTAEVQPHGFSQFLVAEAAKLSEIAELTRLTIEALKDSQGNHAVSTAPTLPHIWSKYGASPDVDSAKLYASHVHRFNVQALATAMEPVRQALEGHGSLLSTLAKGLSEDEEIGLGRSEDDQDR